MRFMLYRMERHRIADAMAFALDHAEQAEEISNIIGGSLQDVTTPIPTKLARLYIISDILHNASAVANGSAYRSQCVDLIYLSSWNLFEFFLNSFLSKLRRP